MICDTLLPIWVTDVSRPRFDPRVRKIPWRREWQPTPVFLPRESHGQRSLAGCSPWGRMESDATEWLTHMSVVSIVFRSFLDGRPGLDTCSRDVRWGGRVWFQGGFSGWLLERPYSVVAGFSQSEWFVRRPRWKLPWHWWPRLASSACLLTQASHDSVGGRPHKSGGAGWQGSLGAIWEAGYHGPGGTCVTEQT